jgi:lipoprotein-releasing system permease protein
MSTSVNFYIATVHLTSSIKQTIVAMLGVTFGISMYVFMTGFMTGVNNIQTELAFSALAHIRVYNDGPADKTNIVKQVYPNDVINLRNAKVIRYTDGIKNSAAILSLLQSQPNVSGVTTQVNINVFFKNAGNKINGMISGVDVINENKVFNISKYVVQGNWNELKQRSDGIFVGYELAKYLSLKINDNLNVLTSDGIGKNYKVIGIYQTGIFGSDKSKAYITINAARQLLAFNQDYVTDIQINVRDFNQTQPLVDKLAPVISYRVESWQMSNHQLEAASGLRDIIAIAVSFTILIVAGFGIYNIMSMTINQKIKEIAILKAMGFSGQDVTVIFLTQSIVIGIIGGFVGMGLGFVISKLVSRVPFEVAGLHTLPMAFTPTDYVLAFIFSLMTTFIAGYLPARKASQVDPVIIIRG